MKYKALLKTVYSVDKYGNQYNYLEFTDFETGKTIKGIVNGGESNIYSILRYWDISLNNWDRSILYQIKLLLKVLQTHSLDINKMVEIPMFYK